MLEGQSDAVSEWLRDVPDRYGILPLMLPPVDWNDDLTPWPAGPIFKKGKPFGGQAAKYLERLEGEIIPSMEAGLQVGQRWMLGISLSGLFAVWAAAKCDLFTGRFSVPPLTGLLVEENIPGLPSGSKSNRSPSGRCIFPWETRRPKPRTSI